MAKKKKKSSLIRLILVIVAVVLGVFSLFTLTMTGINTKYLSFDVSIKLSDFLFGGLALVSEDILFLTSSVINLDGGMSYFVLIAVILVVLAIVCLVLKLVLKKNNLEILGGILLILAGISILLIKVAGTDIKGVLTSPFADWMKNASLGIGTILFAVSSFLGGLSSIASKYIK